MKYYVGFKGGSELQDVQEFADINEVMNYIETCIDLEDYNNIVVIRGEELKLSVKLEIQE